MTKVITAAVTGVVDYPLAADFFMAESSGTLFFYGGSKDYASNVDIYNDGYSYPIESAYNITTSEPGTYKASADICGVTYMTTDVTVSVPVVPSSSIVAFHYAGFVTTDYNSAYSTKEAAAEAGFVYADTPGGTYTWGTLAVVSNTATNTTYTWTPPNTITADVLLVAGGGGGSHSAHGGAAGGAGGAGGLVYKTGETISGPKTIVVGNGGVEGNGGINGQNTTAIGLTALGGGGGAQDGNVGKNGGSGGGGDGSTSKVGGNGLQPSQPSGGFGNNGGTGGGTSTGGGGGGGAGTVGQNGNNSTGNGGNGGDGKMYSISGNDVYYAGGGGGGTGEGGTIGGIGGLGGGGNGGGNAYAQSGSKHTGGGGGGSNDTGTAGSGGSGIVLISSYPVNQLTHDGFDKLTVANTSNANTETNLRLGSNVWYVGSVSDVYIYKPGAYKSFTVDPDGQVAHFGNVTVESVTATTPPNIFTTGTLAFHHGNFDATDYGDATVEAAAVAGRFYANTPVGGYMGGTLNSRALGTTSTTYTWTPNETYMVDMLIVAGGGGGGGFGGGGGAGGVLLGTSLSIEPIISTIKVGRGGIGKSNSDNVNGENGYNSEFNTVISIGGGGGGTREPNAAGRSGSNGGSGGGGSHSNNVSPIPIGGISTQGDFTSFTKYGNSGGSGRNGFGDGGTQPSHASGGGGGAGGAGGNFKIGTNGRSCDGGGDGGPGIYISDIFDITYGQDGFIAGGGGGQIGWDFDLPGIGGIGGGGDGGVDGSASSGVESNAENGVKHTGSGGGGARYNNFPTGGSGGSGIVLIKLPLPGPPASLSYDGYNKLSVNGIDDQTLYEGSNSYALGTASNVYIADPGEYTYFTNTLEYAFLSNVTVGAVSVDLTLSETSIAKQFIYDENGYTGALFSEGSETQSIRLSSDGLAMALGDGKYSSNNGRLYYYERSSISDTFTKTHTFDAVSSGLAFGASVDMNAAKTRIAISGSDADTNAANAGRVYIYDRASTSASWPSSPTATITPPASTIIRFGHTVNMSDDGLTMITSGDGTDSTANKGGVYVYEYAVTAPSASTITFTSGAFTNNNSYYEKGPTTATTVLYERRTALYGLAEGYGLLLEYQSDGTTKAYCNSPSAENLTPDQLSIDGGPFSDSVILISGKVLEGQYYSGFTAFTFTVNSTHLFSQGPEWSKTFQVTQGISRFGYKVAMNKTGTRFIAGGTNTAYYVYHKVSGTWSSTVQLTGATGYHCGMSPDGNTVAVGIVQYSSNLGRVAVYKYSGSSWGSVVNIDTTVGAGAYQIGSTPVFNNDGTLLVTGCTSYNSYMGCIEMWKYESGSWVFKKQFLNPTVKTGHSGTEIGEFFGGYLSMDYAGTSVIVSNTGNDVAGADYGRVVLYGAVASYPSLTYNNLHALVVTGAEASSYITYNTGDGKKLACGTDLSTYQLHGYGNYKAYVAGPTIFTLTNTVTIPSTEIFPIYQYPPLGGTVSSLTTSIDADAVPVWTISGADYANGGYKSKASIATTGSSATSYHAFDTIVTASTGFVSASSSGTLAVYLPSAVVIRKYVVWPYDADTTRPSSWTLEGSNEDSGQSGWTTLHAVIATPPSLAGDVQSLTTFGSYRWYRINVTANAGGSGLKVAELVLWGDIALDTTPTFSDSWSGGTTTVTIGSTFTLPTITNISGLDITGSVDSATLGTYDVSWSKPSVSGLVTRVVRRFVVEYQPVAFHYAGFVATDYNSAYSTKEAAAEAGFVYADTPDGTYTWGSLDSLPSTASNQTTYTWTPPGTLTVDILMVAGGGGGGSRFGGGGGGGGLLHLTNQSLSGQNTVVVGNGGVGGITNVRVIEQSPTNGKNSSFNNNIVYGGGIGGAETYTASNGGSGGGGSYRPGYQTGGTGVSGQGFQGGNGSNSTTRNNSGGGGAGGSGYGGGNVRGDGGIGLQFDISGISTYYGGGGGASDCRADAGGLNSGGFGYGGLGGGGTGGGTQGSGTGTSRSGTGDDGQKHTGGGGGGGAYTYVNSVDLASPGGAGGSGIVIVQSTS